MITYVSDTTVSKDVGFGGRRHWAGIRKQKRIKLGKNMPEVSHKAVNRDGLAA